MKQVYVGKTKDVYRLDDGNYLLQFKDDATGEDGVFDPGANTVGLTIEGLGAGDLRLSEHFFALLQNKGIPTHFVSCDPEAATMTVRPAAVFGRGLEVICRLRAVGSFMRRYGQYASEGQKLPYLVEVTLKDDERGDPPISADTLEVLGLLNADEYAEVKKMAQEVTRLIAEDLAAKGLELYDLKLEFGCVGKNITLIDEISGGNMRVYKDGAPVGPVELVDLVLA